MNIFVRDGEGSKWEFVCCCSEKNAESVIAYEKRKDWTTREYVATYKRWVH